MPSKLQAARLLYGTAFAVCSCILQVVVFILAVIGTPLDAFRRQPKGAPADCLSLWGPRKACNKVSLVKGVPYKGMRCASTEKIITAAAAFAIISIVFALLAIVATILAIRHSLTDGSFMRVMGVLTFISTLICWACQVGALNRQCKSSVSGQPMKLESLNHSGYKIAASPALFITAWCLEVFAGLFIFLA